MTASSDPGEAIGNPQGNTWLQCWTAPAKDHRKTGVATILTGYTARLAVCVLSASALGCSIGERERSEDPSGDDGTDVEWPELGKGTMSGSGSTSDRWEKAEVSRNGVNYLLMANGWGPNFDSQTLSWTGTSFTVESMNGREGSNWEPASYPTVFCGVYSDSRSGECGLPAAIDELESLRTGWSWRPNGNVGEYNAAYDIWLGNGTEIGSFTGFLMVWYRDPPGQQPAGQRLSSGASVENVPGRWTIWSGSVNGRPYLAYARAEGQDTLELEFDVLDFLRDAEARELSVPGTHVLSVAIGFEIWNGPVTNLESTDFFVTAR